MRTKTEITQEDFSRLLGWLAPDADEAARKYEEIRRGLSKFFHFRGCSDSETLADETLNRVAIKIASVEFDGNVKVTSYFYAFAARIFLEECADRRNFKSKAAQIAEAYQKSAAADENETQSKSCLNECLKTHPPAERALLLEYYRYGTDDKIERRKKLADSQGVKLEYLHTKISRLRKTVGKCLRNCLNEIKL